MSWHIRYDVTHQKNQLGKRQRIIITVPANSFLPVLRLQVPGDLLSLSQQMCFWKGKQKHVFKHLAPE